MFVMPDVCHNKSFVVTKTFCGNKSFVMTNIYFCCNKRHLLSQQTCVCRDKTDTCGSCHQWQSSSYFLRFNGLFLLPQAPAPQPTAPKPSTKSQDDFLAFMEGESTDNGEDIDLFGTWDASNIQQSGAAGRGVFRQQNSGSPGLQVGPSVLSVQCWCGLSCPSAVWMVDWVVVSCLVLSVQC